MYVCMCVCVCVCVCVYEQSYTHAYTPTFIHIHTHTHTQRKCHSAAPYGLTHVRVRSDYTIMSTGSSMGVEQDKISQNLC